MAPNPHADQPVVVDGDLDAAQIVVVLLHGRDRQHDDLQAQLIGPCARPDVAFVSPQADGRSWYPASFLAPREDNEPRLGCALERVGGVVADAVHRVGRERVVLAGFSQGACLACEWLHRDGQALGGLAAFTGGLIGPSGTSWVPRPALLGMPAVFGVAEGDDWVPLSRVEETIAVLRESGVDVKLLVRPGSDHIVSDEERTAFVELLERVIHPRVSR